MKISDIKPMTFLKSTGWFSGDTYILIRQLPDGKVVVARLHESYKVYERDKLLRKFEKISEEEFLQRFNV